MEPSSTNVKARHPTLDELSDRRPTKSSRFKIPVSLAAIPVALQKNSRAALKNSRQESTGISARNPYKSGTFARQNHQKGPEMRFCPVNSRKRLFATLISADKRGSCSDRASLQLHPAKIGNTRALHARPPLSEGSKTPMREHRDRSRRPQRPPHVGLSSRSSRIAWIPETAWLATQC
jgi:hypothetical protein